MNLRRVKTPRVRRLLLLRRRAPGALLYSILGYIEPGSFSLLVSVQFIAMVLIGGVAHHLRLDHGRASSSPCCPRSPVQLPAYLPFLSSSATESPNVFQVETLLYGVLSSSS